MTVRLAFLTILRIHTFTVALLLSLMVANAQASDIWTDKSVGALEKHLAQQNKDLASGKSAWGSVDVSLDIKGSMTLQYQVLFFAKDKKLLLVIRTADGQPFAVFTEGSAITFDAAKGQPVYTENVSPFLRIERVGEKIKYDIGLRDFGSSQLRFDFASLVHPDSRIIHDRLVRMIQVDGDKSSQRFFFRSNPKQALTSWLLLTREIGLTMSRIDDDVDKVPVSIRKLVWLQVPMNLKADRVSRDEFARRLQLPSTEQTLEANFEDYSKWLDSWLIEKADDASSPKQDEKLPKI